MTRSQAEALTDAVQLTELINACATLAGDGIERLTLLHLVETHVAEISLLTRSRCYGSHLMSSGLGQGYTTETGLEVQVRTGATTRVTTQANNVTSSYNLVFANQLSRHMTIDGLQTVVVADNNILTIAARLIAYDTYLSAECCTDSVTNIYLDVKTLVLTSPTCAEVRCNYAAGSRHVETTKVNAEFIGKEAVGTADISVVPVLIQVSSRKFGCFYAK